MSPQCGLILSSGEICFRDVYKRQAISLSPELESVEQKLSDVKRTLAERADKAKRAEQQKNDLVVYLEMCIRDRSL